MTKSLLTIADVLKSLTDDYQAENALIASRVTWYVTSQAFMLTAYATSWNSGFQWQGFFHQLIPLAGIALSVLILVSIYAATWAQDNCLREQQRIIGKIRDALELPESAAIALEAYERTMVANRRNAAGKRIGHRIHALVRVTPIVLPFGFALLWIYAYLFAPTLT